LKVSSVANRRLPLARVLLSVVVEVVVVVVAMMSCLLKT
jgi:hypothetical protein